MHLISEPSTLVTCYSNSGIYIKLLRESGKTSETLFHIMAAELTTITAININLRNLVPGGF